VTAPVDPGPGERGRRRPSRDESMLRGGARGIALVTLATLAVAAVAALIAAVVAALY
jgi:hypothetical protein